MPVTITPLTPVFAGEVGAIDLRQVHDASRWRRSAPAWTSTPCWCSAIRISPTRTARLR